MTRRQRKPTMADLVRGLSAPRRRVVPMDDAMDASSHPASLHPVRAKETRSSGSDEALARRDHNRTIRSERRRSTGLVDDAEYSRTASEFTKQVYLSAKEVETIHLVLIQQFKDSDDPIDSLGPREDGHLLRSAVTRPMTGLRTLQGGIAKYNTVTESAAALTHSIIHNHPFTDGNKRTATLALIASLYQNKIWFEATEEELYEAIVDLATHRFVLNRDKNFDHGNGGNRETIGYDADAEVKAFAQWLDQHVIDLAGPPQPMQWRKVRTLLEQRGCIIDDRLGGNKILVERRGRRTRKSMIGARNDGDELDRQTIRKLRKDLDLPSLHTPIGQERNRAQPFVENAITEWRTVLDKLGELDRGRH